MCSRWPRRSNIFGDTCITGMNRRFDRCSLEVNGKTVLAMTCRYIHIKIAGRCNLVLIFIVKWTSTIFLSFTSSTMSGQTLMWCFALCAWLAISSAISGNNSLPSQPKATLPSGPVISGVVQNKYPSVRQFLGIPYAQPPTVDLRWEAPKAISLPSSINATAHGRPCTQFVATTPNAFNLDVPEYNVQNINTTGEDCLTLSIWAPQNATNLPVVVFLYGGGWYTGGDNIAYQIPTQWVQRTKGLIVVIPK